MPPFRRDQADLRQRLFSLFCARLTRRQGHRQHGLLFEEAIGDTRPVNVAALLRERVAGASPLTPQLLKFLAQLMYGTMRGAVS
ncbi:hypothetical protein [Nonomuraea zeae]|uniref:Uncharacterized protein n=1 Tax=Nonomuraea zeae TaxID=1642303 RepID=A0A5S4GJA1_9ACTN|nr:hypothetical protein [Nonomuraea zeae]TMR32995.1 hypothetical protein ETD85_21215 [Nonomuraea zeae]